MIKTLFDDVGKNLENHEYITDDTIGIFQKLLGIFDTLVSRGSIEQLKDLL